MSRPARISLRLAALAAVLTLGACGAPGPAPVIERAAGKSRLPAQAAAQAATPAGPGFHVVKKGETLQSIALEYGLDYKDLITWNNLENPNLIRVGQSLRVGFPDGAVVVRPVATSSPLAISSNEVREGEGGGELMKREPRGGKLAYSADKWATLSKGDDKPPAARAVEPKPDAATEVKEMPDGSVDWGWPASGKLIVGFAEGSSKGLAIGGKIGDPVVAASAGRVLYAGEDLRGYGKLIVLKHNASFLSVYAHNNQILVKEGQMVVKGEKIAELGRSDSDQPKLHFEIRRQGKPVDPATLLPTR